MEVQKRKKDPIQKIEMIVRVDPNELYRKKDYPPLDVKLNPR